MKTELNHIKTPHVKIVIYLLNNKNEYYLYSIKIKFIKFI